MTRRIIVNMSSIGAIRELHSATVYSTHRHCLQYTPPLSTVHTATVYSTTKSALDMLRRNMAAELGPHNFRVNSINPGLVLGHMILKQGDPEVFRRGYIRRPP